jgi:hypothetical protein
MAWGWPRPSKEDSLTHMEGTVKMQDFATLKALREADFDSPALD